MECYATPRQLWRQQYIVAHCGSPFPFPPLFCLSFLILHLIWFSVPVWLELKIKAPRQSMICHSIVCHMIVTNFWSFPSYDRFGTYCNWLNVTQLNIRRLTDVVPEIYRTNKLASAMRNLISGSFSQATRSTIWATCFGVFHDYC